MTDPQLRLIVSGDMESDNVWGRDEAIDDILDGFEGMGDRAKRTETARLIYLFEWLEGVRPDFAKDLERQTRISRNLFRMCLLIDERLGFATKGGDGTA
ncbi:hypothetical protein [Naasia lichenicola]|uniref:Uncharacterized protein n=1 Tax=Naasia lichenicola TaxID=2565933 RepID=A0A4S4FKL4_9MICO|nr:hypothetical protein [Naasia lichenicola]THG30688.1 hypothetical protein E6C64_08590 [Naasia lichenicola]THG31925.1 hypothetical protein E6C64_07735 [Naasia lichenicola]